MSLDSSITVLLIDPHEGERQYWAENLKSCSSEYAVLEAENGRAGLAICDSRPVDCVVTELTLPDISGFEVLITLVPVAQSPQIAVIVLTRQAFHPMSDVAFKNGAQAYLVKARSTSHDLDQSIRKAIAIVGPKKQRPPAPE